MRVYLAGPMTGLTDYNLPAFAAATAQLEALGYEVVNPGRRGVIPGLAWRDYMRLGLADLLTCDAVALLSEWETSRGAQLEAHLAQELDLAVRPLAEWTEAAA